MEIKAKLKHLRIAPRKVRLISDLIRKKPVEQAQVILNFTTNRAALPLLKLLKQAVANAKNNFQLEETNLYIQKINVDEGPKLKRWRPRARGMAYPIQKKTSHITIILDEIEKKAKRRKKSEKIESTFVSASAEATADKKAVADKEEKIKEAPKIEKTPRESKLSTGQAKLKPELEIRKPQIGKVIKRIFRRKAI
jgi:large subunit ribosomal protein L22